MMVFIMVHVPYLSSEWLLFLVADNTCLDKQVRHFRFIFTDREVIGKNKQKIGSHLGPVAQVSERLCEAKPEAKSPWRGDTHGKVFFGIDDKI